MADVLLHATSGEQAISTLNTVLQVVAAANHRTKVQGWGISIKGTSATDPPVLVTVVRQTTAGTMTAGAAGTDISKKNSADTETIQTTVQKNATAEPTLGDIIESFEVHPQTGYRVFYPMGQEIVIPGGGRLGFRVASATLTYSCTVEVDAEE